MTRTACPWLRCSGDAGDLGPNLKGSGPGGSILGGWNLVSAEQEEVVDPVVGGQEALCLPSRLEALHLPLSPSRGLVRVLRPVVKPFVLPVLDRGHHRALCRPVTRQLIRDHDTKCPALPLEQLAHQALGGLRVAPALHQDVNRRGIGTLLAG